MTIIFQQLGPLKAEQSLGTPAMHKQLGMDHNKMSGGQMGLSGGQLGPLRGSAGVSGPVSIMIYYLYPSHFMRWTCNTVQC